MMGKMLMTFLLAVVLQRVSTDNLELLSGTLRTYQRAACDEDDVSLKCPPGTRISVHYAQYGQKAPEKPLKAPLCPPKSTASTHLRATYTHNVSCVHDAVQRNWEEVPKGTWGRTVVEVCQRKQQCKFKSSVQTFGRDPCPGVPKYIEVAYKCRPYMFRSKIACENDRIHLECNPNSRVAIYSATYGRTEFDSIECRQPQGVPEESCLASYATETVLRICHGKRRCELSADANTFGSPCKPESRMYLRVVYNCVPRKVLRDQFKSPPEPDETAITDPDSPDGDDEFDIYDSGNEFIGESAASPPAPNVVGGGGTLEDNNLTKDSPDSSSKPPPHFKSKGSDYDAALGKRISHTTPRSRLNPFRPSRVPATTKDMQGDADETSLLDPNCTYTGEKTRVIGFISEWINAYTFVSQNQERFYLYLIVSIAGGIVLVLCLLVARLLVQRHRSRREAKFHATTVTEHSLPNGFADDISEIDADIDLTTPLPVPVPVPVSSITEVVRYPHVHTLRRPLDCEAAAPRVLTRPASTTHYYYG